MCVSSKKTRLHFYRVLTYEKKQVKKISVDYVFQHMKNMLEENTSLKDENIHKMEKFYIFVCFCNSKNQTVLQS